MLVQNYFGNEIFQGYAQFSSMKTMFHDLEILWKCHGNILSIRLYQLYGIEDFQFSSEKSTFLTKENYTVRFIF